MSFLSAVRDRIASWSAALHGNTPFAPDLEADLPPAHRSPRSRIVIQAPRGLDQTEDVVDTMSRGACWTLWPAWPITTKTRSAELPPTPS